MSDIEDPYIGGLFKWKTERGDRRIRIVSIAPSTMFYGPGYYYRRASADGEFSGVANRVRISASTLEDTYTTADTTAEESK